MATEIGKYLARLRVEAGFKQNELAQKVTWSPAVLSRVESGERPVTPDELDSIVAAIGTEKALKLGTTVGRVWQELERPQFGHPDEDLLWEAEKALQGIAQRAGDPEIKQSVANMLNGIDRELRNVTRPVHRTDHSVAFVGDIGVGKSTAICRVTGLEIIDQKTADRSPVLEVGGGGVTVCEVHLVPGPGYGLFIEPMSDDEINREVREFASLIKSPPALSQEEDSTDQAIGTSKEIERAIRNMSELRVRRITTGRRTNGKPIRTAVDEARELADQCDDTDEFVLQIQARMNLNMRRRRELLYPELSETEPLQWLKGTFESVNNGRHMEVSVPRRIEIMVPQQVLESDDLSIRIVDTKGIDRTAVRPDIESIFGEPNSIMVLCSGFNAVPETSVQSILERAVAGQFAHLKEKIAILALPRPDEALAVKDDQGIRADTEEEGYELKADQAEMRLKAIGVPDVPIEFYNSFQDDSERLRGFLLELIGSLRERHRSDLEAVIDETNSLLTNFEEEKVREVQREAARRLLVWLKSDSQLPQTSFPKLEERLIASMRQVYASSVRASVRRQGEWDNLNYPLELGFGSRLMAISAVSPMVVAFRAVTNNILNDEQFEEASSLVRHALRIIESGEKTLFTKCQLAGQNIHTRQMKPDSGLWNRSDAEWGQGSGYRDRVVGHHRTWFKTGEHQKVIEDLVQREWENILEQLSAVLKEI